MILYYSKLIKVTANFDSKLITTAEKSQRYFSEKVEKTKIIPLLVRCYFYFTRNIKRKKLKGYNVQPWNFINKCEIILKSRNFHL